MLCGWVRNNGTIRTDETLETTDQWCEVVIFTPAEIDSVNLLLNGGFDAESFGIGFGGIITLWITGLTIGMIISHIRKVKKF